METVKKSSLKYWLVDYITNTIHGMNSKDEGAEAFNQWAKSFKKEEAEFVVNMEWSVDWEDDERKKIPLDEVKEYAEELIQTITERWYL